MRDRFDVGDIVCWPAHRSGRLIKGQVVVALAAGQTIQDGLDQLDLSGYDTSWVMPRRLTPHNYEHYLLAEPTPRGPVLYHPYPPWIRRLDPPFLDCYVLGEGRPWPRGAVSEVEAVSLVDHVVRSRPLEWPEPLFRDDAPRYRLVLQRVDKKESE